MDIETIPLPSFTAALLTARGRGAVASILVCMNSLDDDSWFRLPFRAANGKPLTQQAINQVVFGQWGEEPGEDVVLCRTAADRLEIHCHGGFAAAERILADLREIGGETIGWDEQVQKDSGLFQRECDIALSRATTLRAATRLLSQHTAWTTWATNLRSANQSRDWRLIRALIHESLQWSKFGRHLVEPFRVVLTGQPNVGKSSLINALLGFQRSIVFDQPGTTRDVVTSETVWDGWPILLADTAGMRQVATGLEASGIELASSEISTADLVILVLDATAPGKQQDDDYLAQKLRGQEFRTITVTNKIDLLAVSEWGALGETKSNYLISARTGAGLEDLIRAACGMLVPALPAADLAVPFTQNLVNWLLELDAIIQENDVNGIEQHLAILMRGAKN